MGLSAVTYALSKKYTDKTVIGLGGLKGAPCKVKSVVKTDGRSVVTLEWKGDDGSTQTSNVYVDDGVSVWLSGRSYIVNDIVVKDDILYICKTANSDVTFDKTKWAIVGGGGKDYYIINTLAERPSTLDPSDRKIYFCIQTGLFYLWDGIKWSEITTGVKIRELTKAQYDALTPAEKMNGTIYFVTDEDGGASIQVTTLPTASSSELGNIYQYVGPTTVDYTNGCFYRCEQDTLGVYIWNPITVIASGAYETDPIDWSHFH